MSHERKIELEGEFLGEASHARGRLVAVATVLTTLAAAVTGYMQASAIRAHDEADVRAERLGALAINAAASNRDQALVQIERYRVVRQEREQSRQVYPAETRTHRGAVAAVADDTWREVALTTSRDSKAIAAEQEAEVACSARRAECHHRGLVAICSSKTEGTACTSGDQYSPDSDPAFPARYEQAVQWESYRLTARREAADGSADDAEARFAHLAAGLTMLTVSVFLFGYSLTPQGRERRRLFLTTATLFVIAGGTWSLYHALQSNGQAPASAASAFADGEVALNDGNFASAVRHLTRATKLWERSSSAFGELADAEYALSLPTEDPSGLLTVPPVHTLKKAVADDERAIADGSDSPTVTFDLAAELLYLGLQTGNDAQLVEARKLGQDAADRFTGQLRSGKHPGAYLIDSVFTVAEADLALGSAATQHAYCRAASEMIALKNEVSPDLVNTAAHTDIQLIARERPRRQQEGATILSAIDAAVSANVAPGCAHSASG